MTNRIHLVRQTPTFGHSTIPFAGARLVSADPGVTTGQRLTTLRTHAAIDDCWVNGCAIHNPTQTDAANVAIDPWLYAWDSQYGIMYRVCHYGNYHPDLDSFRYVMRTRDDAAIREYALRAMDSPNFEPCEDEATCANFSGDGDNTYDLLWQFYMEATAEKSRAEDTLAGVYDKYDEDGSLVPIGTDTDPDDPTALEVLNETLQETIKSQAEVIKAQAELLGSFAKHICAIEDTIGHLTTATKEHAE